MKNRRNYYRLLCVQPDAPLPVIKSSYSALMLKLKAHPDLGGDHEVAALLNEAYAVLSNPAKRAEYDRILQRRQSKASVGSGPFTREDASTRGRTDAAPRASDTGSPASRRERASQGPAPNPASGGPATSAPPRAAVTPPRPSFEGFRAPDARHASACTCAFCQTPSAAAPVPGVRCAACGSPLCPPAALRMDGGDQRAVPRFAHGGEISIVTRHPGRRWRAAMHDLSPTGMSVMASAPLPIDEVVKAEGASLTAVARVASCRPDPSAPGTAIVGLEFLTLEFFDTRGTFVSRSA